MQTVGPSLKGHRDAWQTLKMAASQDATNIVRFNNTSFEHFLVLKMMKKM